MLSLREDQRLMHSATDAGECPTSFSKQLQASRCGAHSAGTGTNQDNFPWAAAVALAAEQAPTSTRDSGAPPAPAQDQPQEVLGRFSSGTGLRFNEKSSNPRQLE